MPKQTVSCPSCKARFSVSSGQLKVAKGLVRCGACLTVFNAAEALQKTSTPAANTAPPAPPTPPSTAEIPRHTQDNQVAASVGKVTLVPPSKDAYEPLSIPELPMQDMLERPKAKPSSSILSQLSFGLMAIFLLALLLAQITWFNPSLVNQYPALRPVPQWISQQLNVAAPTQQATSKIINERLVIQPHEEYNDVARVSLRLINQADFPQAFPALELRFSDLAGKPVAQRLFQPEEYLDLSLFPQQIMPPQQPVQIQLDILHPGTRAVNYQLELRP